MSQIFYSEVDRNLKAELDARGRAGKTDRSTSALNFMLGKIANVEIIAYKNEQRTTANELAKIGGSDTRSNNFLPNGFLPDKTVQVKNNQFDFNSNRLVQTIESGPQTDSSKRLPPIITSAEINIGDHSMGLLNKATINISVPNPDRDLNWVESVWLRPGRYVRIKIAHPNSAVITGNSLINGNNNPEIEYPTVPSIETIKERLPWFDETDYTNLIKLNEINFDGLVTSFVFNYQIDGTVSATLSLTGTSNIYTDISLLLNTDSSPVPSVAINIPDVSNVTVNSESKNGTNGESVEEQANNQDESLNYIYAELENELDSIVLGIDENIKNEKIRSTEPILAALDRNNGTQFPDWWAIYGNPFPTGSATDDKYVTLGYLVHFIQKLITSKIDPEDIDKFPNITCSSTNDDLITTSIYYENIVSADPSRILLMSDKNGSTNFYGDIAQQRAITTAGAGIQNITNAANAITNVINNSAIRWYGKINNPAINFNQTINNEQVGLTPRIFINLEVIRDITDRLINTNRSKFNVGEFFKLISKEIFTQTGGAVNLKLITDPRLPNSNFLIYFDVNKTLSTKSINVKEYNVPMFANNPNGTIVRDFQFNAKLPDSVKNLSYVLNQNPDKISESDVAPYMNFMYLTNQVERKISSTGQITDTINPDATQLAADLQNRYSELYQRYRDELLLAKQGFSLNPNSKNKQLQLQNALKKYIQYPTDNIQKSNQLTAPIFPFDVEITIDGINGFRYGDVLQFTGLPERYRRNTVFSIINIIHTVSTSGEWTTKLRCIMRPRIG